MISHLHQCGYSILYAIHIPHNHQRLPISVEGNHIPHDHIPHDPGAATTPVGHGNATSIGNTSSIHDTSFIHDTSSTAIVPMGSSTAAVPLDATAISIDYDAQWVDAWEVVMQDGGRDRGEKLHDALLCIPSMCGVG